MSRMFVEERTVKTGTHPFGFSVIPAPANNHARAGSGGNPSSGLRYNQVLDSRLRGNDGGRRSLGEGWEGRSRRVVNGLSETPRRQNAVRPGGYFGAMMT